MLRCNIWISLSTISIHLDKDEHLPGFVEPEIDKKWSALPKLIIILYAIQL